MPISSLILLPFQGKADALSYVVVGVLLVILVFGLFQCACFCLQRCRDYYSFACCLVTFYLFIFVLFIAFFVLQIDRASVEKAAKDAAKTVGEGAKGAMDKMSKAVKEGEPDTATT